MILVDIAIVFGMLSLVSIGGVNAVLPEIRRQVVDVHQWMTDPAFADLFAISHAAPGPNIIMVSLIGWYVAGLAGLIVATIAIMLPSCLLAFTVGRMVHIYGRHPVIAIVKAGLVPVALGLTLASGAVMLRAACSDLLTIGIAVASAVFVLKSRRNPLWVIAAGTLASVAALYI